MSLFRNKTFLFVSFFTTLTALLSVLYIDHKNYALDEIASVLIARNSLPNILTFLFNNEGNMWLYYLSLHFWLYLGNNEFVVRLFSAIPAAASIPFVYLLGKKLFNERTAAVAVIIISINTFLIQNAQNARSYTLVLFLTLLSSYVFVQYVATESKKFLFGYAFVTIISLYAHMYVLFVFAAQLISLILVGNKKVWRNLLLILPFIFIGFLPLFLAPSFYSGQINWILKPGLQNIIGTFLILSGDNIFLAPVYAFLISVYGVILWKKRRQFKQSMAMWNYEYLFLWLIMPVILSFVFSLIVKPIYLSMYFIICLVPFTYLVSLALVHVKNQKLFKALMIFIIVFSFLRLYSWYSENTHFQMTIRNKYEDWKAAAQFLNKHVQKNDSVIYFPPYYQDGVDLYKNITTRTHVYDTYIKSNTFNAAIVQQTPEKHTRVWYIQGEYTNEDIDPQKELVERMLEKNYKQKEENIFESIHIFKYEK